MKILFIEWNSFGRNDLKEAFAAEGHSVAIYPFEIEISKLHHDTELEQSISAAIHREKPDIVFSVAYFAVISKVCNREKIKYVSWTYDNPHVMLYSDTVINPCNVIYVFDKELYMQFCSAGIKTVYYMPMAANTDRLDRLDAQAAQSPAPGEDAASPFAYDVSFLGSLYLEKNNYYDKMAENLPDYAKGYLDGLIAAQLKIHGYDFIEESLGPVVQDLYKALPMAIQPGGLETLEYLYANYIINRRITAIERLDLLEAVSKRHTVDIFTYFEGFSMPNLRNHGYADYNTEMPLVFKRSKINLNITLRGIRSGVPLRAFDIMGAGGFLLSNFQADYLDLFVPGEDFVYYESKEDLLQKIDYYLTHEEERAAIARNGHDKVAAAHTYRHRVREMLERV